MTSATWCFLGVGIAVGVVNAYHLFPTSHGAVSLVVGLIAGLVIGFALGRIVNPKQQ